MIAWNKKINFYRSFSFPSFSEFFIAYFFTLPSHSLPSVKWKSKDFRKKKKIVENANGNVDRTTWNRAAQFREIARREQLAERTGLVEKSFLATRGMLAFFSSFTRFVAHVSFRKKYLVVKFHGKSVVNIVYITFILSPLFFNPNILIVLDISI